MNRFFNTLLSTIKTKIVSLWTKFKLWTSPTFIKSRILTRIRIFFTNLLNIKPRDKKDYYTLLGWMVSKRLAFAAIVILGVISLWYISIMKPSLFSSGLLGSSDSVRTYKYNAVPLKFYSGQVRILAKDKYVAYVGNVKDGVVTGNGKLYNRDGVMLYEGEFDNNMFNGKGRQYYENGILQYNGEFTDNVYNGMGTSYDGNGLKQYTGEFAMGSKSGQGELYNGSGDKIYAGAFQGDNLVYSELVGKTTQEVAAMYLGDYTVYSDDSDYSVVMSEIDAAYYGISGEDTLDNSWSIGGVFVLKDFFLAGETRLAQISDISAYLGEPVYSGNSYLTLSEAVAVNTLVERGYTDFDKVSMETSQEYDNVYQVNSFDKEASIYLYTYKSNGFLYTFYCRDRDGKFAMYLIEKE